VGQEFQRLWIHWSGQELDARCPGQATQ
jgi:hypothetical protein